MLALQFAAAWGCQVSGDQRHALEAEEARSFGAHDVQLAADGFHARIAMT